MQKNKIIFFGVIFMLVIGAVFSITAIIYLRKNINNENENQDYTTKLGSEESRSLLESIVQNNPVNTLANGITQASKTTGGTREASELALAADQAYSSIIYPDQGKNYNHVKVESQRGPAAASCALFDYINDGVYEGYSFYDDSNDDFSYYSKSISYDKDGELIDYYLDSNGENVQFRGGKYAVKTKYSNIMPMDKPDDDVEDVSDGNTVEGAAPDKDLPESSSSSSELPLEDYITTYFGEDATVEKVIENGEIDSYIVTWKYKTTCDYRLLKDTYDTISRPTSSEDNQEENTIIIKSWFDPKSYLVTKEIDYLDEEKDEKILITTNTQSENQDTLFEKVKRNFEFEFDVPIKEVDYTNTQEDYITAVDNYLKDKPQYILYPTDTKFTFGYLYSNYIYNYYENTNNYLVDRDFYISGSKGDKLYEDAKSSFIPFVDADAPYLDYNYSYYSTDYIDYVQYVVQIFDKDKSSDIVASRLAAIPVESLSKATKTSGTIKINGEAVSTEVYTLDSEYFIGKPEPARDLIDCSSDYTKCIEPDGGQEYVQKIFLTIFTYKDAKYGINIAGFNIDSYDDLSEYLNSKSYDMSNSAQRAKFMQLVEDAYLSPSSSGGREISGSGAQD